MVYDPVRDRLLVFGGTTASPGEYSNQVWVLSLNGPPVLTQVVTVGTPPAARAAASMIYDSVRDRVVVFGGTNGLGLLDDVWELTLSGTPAWSELSPSGSLPPPLAYHTAIYDAPRDRMVVFGGYDGAGEDQNQVRILTFAGTPTWSLMTPSGTPPVPRSYHTAVYDGPRDRMVVFGGHAEGETPSEQNDTWALALSGSGSWSQITPNGGPPAIRYGQTAVVDGPRNRMLVFGGFVDDAPYEYGDVWSLSFTNPIKWTQLNPSGPTPVPAPYFSSIYDPARQRLLLLSSDEFWTLGNLSGTPAWSMLTPAGQVPRRRVAPVVVHDAPRQRMLMFGGYAAPEGVDTNDLWAYSLTGGGWSRIPMTSPSPPGRAWATGVYDPAGDRLILFGGSNDIGLLNDVWQLSLAGTPTWTELSPSGTPPSGRNAHSAILDAPRNRVVIYGGADDSAPLSDVWALSLSGTTSWSALNPTGGPAPARELHSAVFDAPRNRMLTFGWDSNVVWALGLAGTPSWSALSPTGTPPPALAAHVAAYDPARDRMLISMGESVGSPSNLTYELKLAGTPAWGTMGTTTSLPPPRAYLGSMFDAAADRWVLFGGNSAGQNFNDVESLSFPATHPLSVQASPVAGGSVQVNPAGECQAAGSQVTLTAVPAANYLFTGWSGDASGTTNPLTVTMDAAKNITANFDNYTLNVFISPLNGGTVTRNPQLAFYPPNSQVSLTANPATGFGFVNWSGDATGSANPLVVTMTSSKDITANFATYALTVSTSPSGAGTVTKNPDQASYPPGTQVTLTASSTFPFLGWSGDASGATNPLVVTMNGPKNITASFGAFTVTAAVSPTGSGTVAKSPNQTFYGSGSKIQIGATAAAGYVFSSWSGDLTGTTNPDSLLVNGNKTVTANFTTGPPICGGWSVISTATQPAGRDAAAAIWDPVRHRMLVSGGAMGYYVVNSDLWSLTLGGTPAWNLLLNDPGDKIDRFAFYDPVRDRMLVFGGRSYGYGGGYDGSPSVETWGVALTGTPTWTQIVTAHTPPARTQPSVVYDPLRDRLLHFGGGVQVGPGQYNNFNDVWQLNLSGTPDWTQVATAGTPPPPRRGAGAIYDPVRDRLVIMAGNGTNPTGAWALSLAGTPSWNDLNPWGAPHVTNDIRPVYDPVGDRALVIWGDGTEFVSTLDFKIDPNQPVWVKSYPARSAGTVLGTRMRPAVVYDPDDDVALVFGGSTGTVVYTNTTVRLDLGPGNFVDAAAIPAINGHIEMSQWCYGSGEIATLMAIPNQGYAFNQWLGDASGNTNPLHLTMDGYKVIRAEFVAATTDVEERPTAFAVTVHPNPSEGPAIEYSVPREAKVRLSVFDVAGREIARLVDGSQPAGRHQATWSGTAAMAHVRAGIYVVRFETPEGTWTKRFTLLR